MEKTKQLIIVIVIISLFVAYKYYTDKNTNSNSNTEPSCTTYEPPLFDCSMCSAPQTNTPTVYPAVTPTVYPSVTPFSS